MSPTSTPSSVHVPRRADFLLYLDLDGVVQHEAVVWHPRRGIHVSSVLAPGHSLFEWVPLLVTALEPFPEVRIVLSSSWCIRPGYGRTLKRLPETLRQRFIGGTFHRRVHGADTWLQASFQNIPRGMQVWADVQRRRPRQWLALDDDVEGWPPWAQENLIACDGSTGLSSAPVLEEFAAKLKRCAAALHM